ncbi:uncharacterized protein BX663DRAFT_510139 [Cokeromyces recurvatus]|uniref:uncharacterized protein n=1 Tax=Cokeromyces recurvatus TaxID=90255 RepID=UPI0022205368|nr:uncharacterized protein BX663DRAFT_510139 [Cokeromyces recurvatus]KAI7902689.1 hypothetical protein BX663DRAFT_510139 [Cokeromyces recurvatus]
MTETLKTVYAIHDFKAENEDELNFQNGEAVIVLQNDSGFDDGWWKGQNTKGEIGLFPVNFITFQKPVNTQQVSEQQQQQPYTPVSASGDILKQDVHSITEDHKQQQQQQQQQKHDSLISTQFSIDDPVTSYLTDSSSCSTSSSSSAVSFDNTVNNNCNTLRRLIIDASFLPELSSTSPEDWGVNQVEVWLKAIHFDSIATNFKLQEITGDVLLELNMNSLKELDVPTYGKRFKLFTAIKTLREEYGYRPAQRMSDSYFINNPRRIYQKKDILSASTISTNPSPSRNMLLNHHYHPLDVSLSNYYYNSSPTKFSERQSKRNQNRHHSKFRRNMYNDESFNRINSCMSPISNYDCISINNQHHHNLPALSNKIHIDLTHQLHNHPTDVPMIRDSSLEFYFNNHQKNTDVAPDMEGWLYKQGCKYKNWNKRWFVLKGTNLFYFKSPTDVRMKGIINLRGYKIIADETIQPGKYSFKAQHEKERTFYFYTEIDTIMKTWVKCLMKATISRDFNIPVLSSSLVPTVSLDVARRMRPRPPSILLYNDTTTRNSDNSDLPSSDTASSYMSVVEHNYEQSFQASDKSYSNSIVKPSNAAVSDMRTVSPDYRDKPNNQDSGFHDRNSTIEQAHLNRVINEQENNGEANLNGHIIKKQRQEEKSTLRTSFTSWTAAEYIQWVNTISNPNKISQLKDLKQGDILINLLEELSGKQLKQLPPSSTGTNSMLMLDNMVAVFKFMSMENIDTEDQFTIKDILDGNEEMIMLMLQAILKWSIRSNNVA